jgi:hypothetical protein
MICNLIDQLCFENSIDPCYDQVLVNNLTSQKIITSHKKETSGQLSKTHTVADIPDFLNVQLLKKNNNLHLNKIPQYKGYLIDLTKFKNAEDLFSQTLSRNPRKNFRAKKRKLESNHDISYGFYYGEIDKDYYDYLFATCYKLMVDRFQEKKIYNRNLIKWKSYHEFFYPEILNKRASVFVISDKTKPITITLNFHIADIVFSHIQIYDVNYSQYSMGDIAIYKNIEWCYENDFKIWDFSKGATANKLRWSNHIYQFSYHLFYNPKSLRSRVSSFLVAKKLALKQFLRDKGIIGGILQLDRLYYYTKKKKLKNDNWKNSLTLE